MAASPAKKARVDPTASPFKVFYPGEEGSLAHIATTRFFSSSPNAELQGVGTFADVFNGLTKGGALYAVVPIENSASGCIAPTYDLLAEHNVVIGGELGVRENYKIVATEGVTLANVRRLMSHPNILDACSSFIDQKLSGEVELMPTRNTTEAARKVAQDDNKVGGCSAAICTREAAIRTNLNILASNVANYTHLETRYILLHRSTGPEADMPSPFPRDAVSPVRKHSAVFVISDEPNSLCKILSCFANRNINILKVETRPLKGHQAPLTGRPAGHLWDFMVFVDYAVPPGQTTEANERLWSNLVEFSVWRRDFGIYPSQTSRKIKKETQSWDDMIDIMTKA